MPPSIYTYTDEYTSLYLDVWVPPNASTTTKLPVKVWVYGGSGTAGSVSEPLYNGCNLATDAVVVSMNYRLGAFGWFALETANLYGNYGAADIIQALDWVQENIAAFGGDPVRL
jgi:carboxylesterase type B